MATQKRGLRVCTAVVRAELKSNEERVELARRVIAEQPGRIDLIVLPAGFLRARSEGEVREVAAPLLTAARKAKVAVMFGVDAGARGSVRAGSLPYFLLGWSPGQSKASLWRQRSITSADAGEAPHQAFASARALEVKGQKVAPIVCGEVFSPRVRDSVAKLKPVVAVLAAHTAGGARHWAGQRCLAQLGVRSVRAVHATTQARDLLCAAGGELPPAEVSHQEGVTLSCFDV